MSKASAQIVLCLGAYGKAIYESLLVELSQPSPRKATIEVEERGGCVELRLSAQSISSLRSVLNSYIYLTYAIYSSLKALQE
ncbi:MAG: KEOPS complex subunit Pcc1 [Acidilobaceae archaeon]|nr:KEOPS complex subunit Pcc1 [Acidilobaceae archaeon]